MVGRARVASRPAWLRTGAAALAALAAACAPPPEPAAEAPSPANPLSATLAVGDALAPPAAEGSFAPEIAVAGDELLLTWIEPAGDPAAAPQAHRVLFARWSGGTWSAPAVVVDGPELFANWADFPAVVPAADGSLYAHWLGKTGGETYAYSIFLARSTDGGATWEQMGRLNDDETATEHGFVSWLPEGDGARAFWLDGRQWVEGGPMSLRTARVGAAGVRGAERLDAMVCDCCSTSAAAGPAGPVIAYRDRSENEIRDISMIRWTGDGWSGPAPVARDGWRIEGCPVNGPEVAAGGERMAVAWFTAAHDQASVQVALSPDGGASFGEPLRVDGGRPLGRADVVLDGDGAWVAWLAARDGGRAEVRLRRVAGDGSLGEAAIVAETSSARASGFPRLVRLGERLVLAWVDLPAAGPSRVRVKAVG